MPIFFREEKPTRFSKTWSVGNWVNARDFSCRADKTASPCGPPPMITTVALGASQSLPSSTGSPSRPSALRSTGRSRRSAEGEVIFCVDGEKRIWSDVYATERKYEMGSLRGKEERAGVRERGVCSGVRGMTEAGACE